MLATTPTDENSAAKEKWNQTAIALKRHKTKHKQKYTQNTDNKLDNTFGVQTTTTSLLQPILLLLLRRCLLRRRVEGKKNTYYQFHRLRWIVSIFAQLETHHSPLPKWMAGGIRAVNITKRGDRYILLLLSSQVIQKPAISIQSLSPRPKRKLLPPFLFRQT